MSDAAHETKHGASTTPASTSAAHEHKSQGPASADNVLNRRAKESGAVETDWFVDYQSVPGLTSRATGREVFMRGMSWWLLENQRTGRKRAQNG